MKIAGLTWRKLVVVIALPAILALFYNQSANWHFHILSNGILVEHAHPFKNSQAPGKPVQNHQHSDLEYTILAQLSNIAALTLVVLALLGFLVDAKIAKSAPAFTLFFSSVEMSARLLRAPPFYSFRLV